MILINLDWGLYYFNGGGKVKATQWQKTFCFLIKREFCNSKLKIRGEQYKLVFKHSFNVWQEGRVLKMALFRIQAGFSDCLWLCWNRPIIDSKLALAIPRCIGILWKVESRCHSFFYLQLAFWGHCWIPELETVMWKVLLSLLMFKCILITRGFFSGGW